MSPPAESVFASLPHMERGVAKVLGGDPKGNNFLYTNGKSVIIRNIENPAIADVYTEHPHQVIVAKYAPSGFYIASGDVSGKIRIWDTTQKEHLLKYEYQPFGGKIKDIAWTEDSKRVAVVGEGREKFGAVFLWDSGSSVGEIVGHSKIINSVDIKQTRPYRLVTGSDDNCTTFLEGPPFKFKCTISVSLELLFCVVLVSVSVQIFLYEGKTGEKLGSLGGEKAHDGGIYAVSWSPDSTQLISASGDKTVKLWDVGSGTAVTTFNLGSDVLDQQLGCLWQKNHLLSVSLSGYINYLDRSNPDRPLRTIKGHTKSIQCLTVHKTDGRSSIYSASHDGHINILQSISAHYWDSESGENEGFVGKGHSNLVSRMTPAEAHPLRVCVCVCVCVSASDVVKMDMQPKCVSVGPGGLAVTVCDAAVRLQDGKVRLYSVQGNTLKDDGKVLEVQGPVTDMSYSPDGAFLAVTDEKKVISVFTVADGYTEKSEFYGHHAKVVCLSWSPDNERFATGGMDMMVYVWTVSDPDKRIKIPDAHRLHHVSGLAWLNPNTLVTTSHDACVKQWNLKN
uniref:WD repeat domain 1 n=1 Tax=Cyprinus carpio carpio TaxID=630221 RepID=A0A9J7YZ34_CYPCA